MLIDGLGGERLPAIDLAHVAWPEVSNAQNSMAAVFGHTAVASDALFKLRDVLVGFGEVISLVEHGDGSWEGSILFAHHELLAMVFVAPAYC
jgi:hypothetical protein